MPNNSMYAIDDYEYNLPPELIAQQPLEKRDSSRLLVLDSRSNCLRHEKFDSIVDYFGPDDLLVFNNSRVIPARIFGKRETGGKLEMLLLTPVHDSKHDGRHQRWNCLLKASRKIRKGSLFSFGPKLSASVIALKPDGVFEVALRCDGDLQETLEEIGHIPLPPYIERPDGANDRIRYQTVYATEYGSVACPTAGLHFTPELLRDLEHNEVEHVFLTLHVGLGTFRPVKETDFRNHRMHTEMVEVSERAAETINRAKLDGKRIVAVGTTSVRVLEFMGKDGYMRSGRESCDLFIYPGYTFKMVDAIITNFHYPRSTLLLLCAAFVGNENILSAYREAVRLGYRFLSYGDAMLIV